MKKSSKIVLGALSAIAAVGGALFVAKNFLTKNSEDDFKDDFDDLDVDDEKEDDSPDDRGYVTVSIDLDSSEDGASDEASDSSESDGEDAGNITIFSSSDETEGGAAPVPEA